MKMEEYAVNCSLRTQRLAKQILSDDFVEKITEVALKKINLQIQELGREIESYNWLERWFFLKSKTEMLTHLIKNKQKNVEKKVEEEFLKEIGKERDKRLMSMLPNLGKYYSSWVGSRDREWSHTLSIYEKIESDGVVAVVLRYRDDLGVDGRKRSIYTVMIVDVDKGEKLYSWSSTPAEKYSGIECSKDNPEEVVFEIEYIDRQLGSHDYKRIIVTHKKS